MQLKEDYWDNFLLVPMQGVIWILKYCKTISYNDFLQTQILWPSLLPGPDDSKHEGQAMKADINYVNESIDSIFEMPHLFF